jgi:DNA-binding CsgD family transcriptional regulator
MAFIGHAKHGSTHVSTHTRVGTCGVGRAMRGETLSFMELREVHRFVDAATVLCDASRRLGVSQTAVALHFERGPVALCVDNHAEIADVERMRFMAQHNWDHNPMFRELRQRVGHKVLGLEQGYPVIGPTGWFATILQMHTQPYGIELERELAMFATKLSVWCTERGVGAIPDTQIDTLTARQYRIAELAARGFTNQDIAEQLAISVNTVKVRLKQIFIRVRATNRTELANVLRRLAPLQDVPIGISHHATVAVTRVVKTP